ncbi:hypothetical protein [Nannocystis pusilla]|uniref:hypothetical protein n=1 Tax=Nannocystis pusilla TaxID=889268 RepID=UPI003B78B3C7
MRELARGDAASVAERLAAERWLRVDGAVPADANQSRHVLLAGELAEAPATYAALKQDFSDRVKQEILLGGEDAARPVVFRDVAEGIYTVCVSVTGPASAEERALVERAMAIYEADGPQPLNGEKLQAAVDAAQAETGIKPKRTDWDPPRCGAAASRSTHGPRAASRRLSRHERRSRWAATCLQRHLR